MSPRDREDRAGRRARRAIGSGRVSLGWFLSWVLTLGLGLASYVWLAWAIVRSSAVPRASKWSPLVPPWAVYVAFRAGGWPRAAALSALLTLTSYALLRFVL